jgi:hypothetical protein
MRLETGVNIPDPETIRRIYDVTNGLVSLHDWFTANATPKPQQISAAE